MSNTFAEQTNERTMGAAMQMTVEQYAELYGKRTDAVQKKLRQKFAGERFALDSELSPEHIAELSVDGRRSKRANIARKVLAETSPKVREKLQRYYDTATPEQVVEDMQAIGSDLVDFAPKEKPQPKQQPAPEPEWVEIVVDKPAPEPEPEEEQWTQEQERPFYRKIDFSAVRLWCFYALLVLVVVGHAGLIWFDCSVLWGAPGVIGGGMSFLIAMASVLLSFDSDRPRTSSTAIWVVFFVDIAAWFVHFPTFKASAAHVGDLHTGFISAFICLFSFAALYMLRDSNLD